MQQRRDKRALLVVMLVDTDAGKRKRVANDVQVHFKTMLEDGTMQILEVRKGRQEEGVGVGGYGVTFVGKFFESIIY